jgi:energy-coupling factor transporter ATP-binding protein EcfA2
LFIQTLYAHCEQVVMPTVEADVAFGLGQFDLTEGEVRNRVTKALEAVGMVEYLQVWFAFLCHLVDSWPDGFEAF